MISQLRVSQVVFSPSLCRDIKGGNVLVDDGGRVKLADFGASTKVAEFGETQETSTIKGTPFFMAP